MTYQNGFNQGLSFMADGNNWYFPPCQLDGSTSAVLEVENGGGTLTLCKVHGVNESTDEETLFFDRVSEIED